MEIILIRKKESEKSISRLKRSKHEGNSANCQSLFCVCETEAGGESREQRLQAEDGAAEAAGEFEVQSARPPGEAERNFSLG